MPRVKWKTIENHPNYELSNMGDVRQHAWDMGLIKRRCAN